METKQIPKWPEHMCFRNAVYYAKEDSEMNERAIIVHGKVRMVTGKIIDHAWVEYKNEVHDPTLGLIMDKAQYYKLLHAKPEKTYKVLEAQINMARAGNWGPWEESEINKVKASKKKLQKLVASVQVRSFSEINNDNEALQEEVQRIYLIRRDEIKTHQKGFAYKDKYWVLVRRGTKPTKDRSGRMGYSDKGTRLGRGFKKGIPIIEVSYTDTFFKQVMPIESFYSIRDFNKVLSSY